MSCSLCVQHCIKSVCVNYTGMTKKLMNICTSATVANNPGQLGHNALGWISDSGSTLESQTNKFIQVHISQCIDFLLTKI